jgi:hypothetical protein
MNKKIVISGSIIALLLLYIVVSNLKRSGDVPELPRWEGVADEIMITGSGGGIRVFKKDGRWLVGDKAYPADPKIAGEVENRFKDMRVTDLISSRGYYARYDLTPDKYTEVIIKKSNKIIRKIKIGKKSSTGRHTFVKVNDKPEIYLAEGTFDIIQNKKADDFRDKDVLKITRGSVSSFTVEYQGAVFAFSRESDQNAGGTAAAGSGKKQEQKQGGARWVCRGYDAVKLDTARVESLLQSLDPLRASSFPDIQKEALPQRTCVVKVKAGQKEIVLTMYRKDDTYLATTSETPYVFAVEKYNIEKFFMHGLDQVKAPAQ